MYGTCRDSFGVFNDSIFNVWTCSLCYVYLFPAGDLRFNFNSTYPGLTEGPISNTGSEEWTIKVSIVFSYYIKLHKIYKVYILNWFTLLCGIMQE